MAVAQQSVNQSDGPPSGLAMQSVYVVNGSNLTTAICWANSRPTVSNPRTAAVAIASCTKASPAVCTSTGHGFTLLTLPEVAVSGATGTGWTGINAAWVATVVDANTFSIPIDSTGFGTLAGTVVFTTTAPRQTVAEWAVKRLLYTGTNVTASVWLGGNQGLGQKCSNASSTTIASQ